MLGQTISHYRWTQVRGVSAEYRWITGDLAGGRRRVVAIAGREVGAGEAERDPVTAGALSDGRGRDEARHRRWAQSHFGGFSAGRKTVCLHRDRAWARRAAVWESLEEGKAHAFSPEGVGPGIVLSGDGQFVADFGPDRKAYLSPVAGGEAKPVPGLQPEEVPTGWSSDGRALFVLARGEVPAQVYRVELTTGQRTFWKSVEPADAAGIDTIGRVMMSADNKAYVYSYVRTLSDLYLVEGLK